jgi:hypothetical protein
MILTTNNGGNMYRETNPISPEYHKNFSDKIKKQVPWNTKGLKVVRLRMLSDVGFPFWDISYCHGILKGEPVEVILPFDQLPKRGMIRAIVEHAIRDKVYAKELNIINPLVFSCLQ